MSAIFKKSDIKAGYLLKVKDTKEDREFFMTVVPTCEYWPSLFASLLGTPPREAGDLACCNPGKDWWPLSEFDDELTANDQYQVVAVYGYAHPKDLLDNNTEDRELLWECETVETPDEVEAEEQAEETRPAPLNCKVVCTSNTVPGFIPLPDFTAGKVYEVKDGHITDDDGHTFGSCDNIRSLSECMGRQFIQVVEG